MIGKITLPSVLRWVAVFLLASALISTIYAMAAPAIEHGFTLKPRAWFRIRFYLAAFTNALFAPCLLFALAELIQLKKEGK